MKIISSAILATFLQTKSELKISKEVRSQVHISFRGTIIRNKAKLS